MNNHFGSKYNSEKRSGEIRSAGYFDHPLYDVFPDRFQFQHQRNEYAFFSDVQKWQYLNEEFRGHNVGRAMLLAKPPFQLINSEKIKNYLEQAISDEIAFIDPGIFCVLNISDYLEDESLQTLVFYENGQVLKTMEASNRIMERIFKRVGVGYEQIRFIIQSIEKKSQYSSPYVLGNASYIPLNGPSKNNVTWVSLGHLVSFDKIDESEKHLRLEFKNRHMFNAKISMDSFQRQLDTATQIFSWQHHFLHKASHLFGFHLVQQDHTGFQSLLFSTYNEKKYTEKYSFEDFLLLMMFSIWREIKKDDLFKENPLVDEINDYIAQRFPSFV